MPLKINGSLAIDFTELDQNWRSVPPTPFLNKWEFYRIMVLEHIDWPQPGCTSPSLETVKPVMGWTQWGCDWHVPRAFGAQGCTLLRVLQGGRCPRRHPAGLACQHCMEHEHPQPCLCSVGLVTSTWRALVLLCKDSTQGCVSLPTWGDSARAGGTDRALHKMLQDSAEWWCGKPYYLPHVSVALNRVRAERPVGFCRGDVSPSERVSLVPTLSPPLISPCLIWWLGISICCSVQRTFKSEPLSRKKNLSDITTDDVSPHQW